MAYLCWKLKGMLPSTFAGLSYEEKLVINAFVEQEIKEKNDELEEIE